MAFPELKDVDWGYFNRPWVKPVKEKPLMRSEQEVIIWQRFIETIIQAELPGDIVCLNIEETFKFPKVLYQFRGYMWCWDLLNLEPRIATKNPEEISARLTLDRVGKKRCTYRVEGGPPHTFYLDKNKLPTIDKRKIHRNVIF